MKRQLPPEPLLSACEMLNLSQVSKETGLEEKTIFDLCGFRYFPPPVIDGEECKTKKPDMDNFEDFKKHATWVAHSVWSWRGHLWKHFELTQTIIKSLHGWEVEECA